MIIKNDHTMNKQFSLAYSCQLPLVVRIDENPPYKPWRLLATINQTESSLIMCPLLTHLFGLNMTSFDYFLSKSDQT